MALAASAVPIALVIWYNVHYQAQPGYQVSTFIASTVFYLPADAAAWAVGKWSRSARDAVEHHKRRLARASEAVEEERRRIARELHDILSHTVTVMVLQASGARRVLVSDPAGADDALSHVEEVGKTAMGDLRRMLTLVRSAALNNDEPCQRGLADIGYLIDDLLRSGVTAQLEVQGSPVQVAESVGRTVYRIVQEAVTNIVKHAGPGSTAIVRLAWGADLRIEIIDDGSGIPLMESAAFSTGQGLLGLAERVAVFGGTISAGPHHNGFLLVASLPLGATDAYIPTRDGTEEMA
jgi:signal transduction histidine kinase